jgi:hypothetical protein
MLVENCGFPGTRSRERTMENSSFQKMMELLATQKPKQTHEPLSLSPYHPISMRICRICWNILDNQTAYCKRCGHAGTCFLGSDVFGMCFQHSDRHAEHVCNYCVRPFCMECLTVNPDTSLCFGGPTYRCHLCSREMQRLTQAVQTRDTSYCFRHPDLPANNKCSHCAENICDFCAYYPVKGLLRKKAEPTPLCFECVRGRVGHRIPRCIVKCNAQRSDWSKYVLTA